MSASFDKNIQKVHQTKSPGKRPTSLPLTGQVYFLNLSRHRNIEDEVQKGIVDLGGKLEEFFNKDVTCVLTDEKYRNTDQPVASTSSNLNENSSKSNPNPNGKVSFGSLCFRKPPQKGVTKKNMVIEKALQWGLKIQNIEPFLSWMRHKIIHKQSTSHSKFSTSKLKTPTKVISLKDNFIKVESINANYKPMFKNFTKFPEVFCKAGYLKSPFDESSGELLMRESEDDFDGFLFSNEISKKPKTTILAQTKKKVQEKRHYCECCTTHFSTLGTHLKGPRHEGFANKTENFDCVFEILERINERNAQYEKRKKSSSANSNHFVSQTTISNVSKEFQPDGKSKNTENVNDENKSPDILLSESKKSVPENCNIDIKTNINHPIVVEATESHQCLLENQLEHNQKTTFDNSFQLKEEIKLTNVPSDFKLEFDKKLEPSLITMQLDNEFPVKVDTKLSIDVSSSIVKPILEIVDGASCLTIENKLDYSILENETIGEIACESCPQCISEGLLLKTNVEEEIQNISGLNFNIDSKPCDETVIIKNESSPLNCSNTIQIENGNDQKDEVQMDIDHFLTFNNQIENEIHQNLQNSAQIVEDLTNQSSQPAYTIIAKEEKFVSIYNNEHLSRVDTKTTVIENGKMNENHNGRILAYKGLPLADLKLNNNSFDTIPLDLTFVASSSSSLPNFAFDDVLEDSLTRCCGTNLLFSSESVNGDNENICEMVQAIINDENIRLQGGVEDYSMTRQESPLSENRSEMQFCYSAGSEFDSKTEEYNVNTMAKVLESEDDLTPRFKTIDRSWNVKAQGDTKLVFFRNFDNSSSDTD